MRSGGNGAYQRVAAVTRESGFSDPAVRLEREGRREAEPASPLDTPGLLMS